MVPVPALQANFRVLILTPLAIHILARDTQTTVIQGKPLSTDYTALRLEWVAILADRGVLAFRAGGVYGQVVLVEAFNAISFIPLKAAYIPIGLILSGDAGAVILEDAARRALLTGRL